MIKNKPFSIVCIVFLTALLIFSVSCAFLFVPTASAVENVTTSFKSYNYFNNIMTYVFNETDITQYNNYNSLWYINFVVGQTDVDVTFYGLDVNYQSSIEQDSNGYIVKELEVRGFDSTDNVEDYFQYYSGTTFRIVDYVLEYEKYGDSVNNSTPTYLTIAYTPLAQSRYTWTAKRFDTLANSYLVTTYTWGNDFYRLAFSFVARYTEDFYTTVNRTGLYNYTMYFGIDFSSDQYQNGYDRGYDAGITDAKNSVDKNSQSYIKGYEDAMKATDKYSFLNLIGAIFDAPIQAIQGLLNFEIFGVDMSGFYLSLFTLALVLLVLRLIFGGR